MFTGNAALLHYRDLSLAGRLAAINVIDAERLLFQREVDWPALATGTLDISGILGKSPRGFIVRTSLDLSPAPGYVPVSGHLELTYHQAGRVIDLANARLNLPHSRLAATGTIGENLQVAIDTNNFDDLRPLRQAVGPRLASAQLPTLLSNGNAHFDGAIAGPLSDPHITGNILLSHFDAFGESWDSARTHAELSSNSAILSAVSIDQGSAHASGTARLQLTGWSLNANAPISTQAQFRGVSLTRLLNLSHIRNLPLTGGAASGSLDLEGRLDDPQGTAHVIAQQFTVFDQPLDRMVADVQLRPGEIRISNGRAQTGFASLLFSGAYDHLPGSWSNGQLHIKADSNVFPLANLASTRQYSPGWNAQVELHGEAGLKISAGHVEPTVANGILVLRQITQNKELLGDVTLDASTKGEFLYAGFSGDLRDTHLKGNAEVHLVPGSPTKGQLQIDRIGLRTLYALLQPAATKTLPVEGSLRGVATFEGPLAQPGRIKGTIRFEDFTLRAAGLLQGATTATTPALIFHNAAPILLDAVDGRLAVRSFQLTGRDTNLAVKGSITYLHQTSLDLKADGSLDFRIFQLFQPGIQSSGRSLIAASITGAPAHPVINGTLEIQNGSLFANGFPNGLTAVNGTLRFDGVRATIQKLTAQTGGGTLSAAGFIDFGGGPMIYRLDGSAESVRVRYANSISVTCQFAVAPHRHQQEQRALRNRHHFARGLYAECGCRHASRCCRRIARHYNQGERFLNRPAA